MGGTSTSWQANDNPAHRPNCGIVTAGQKGGVDNFSTKVTDQIKRLCVTDAVQQTENALMAFKKKTEPSNFPSISFLNILETFKEIGGCTVRKKNCAGG